MTDVEKCVRDRYIDIYVDLKCKEVDGLVEEKNIYITRCTLINSNRRKGEGVWTHN